eukprot:g1487.t1
MPFPPRAPPGAAPVKEKDLRNYNLYWQHPKMDKRGQSMMPLELRNLSPNSTFSAGALWAKTKEAEADRAAVAAEDASEAAAAEKAAKKAEKAGKKGKSKAAEKTDKRADMRAANDAKLNKKAIEVDTQRLERLGKTNMSAVMEAKMETDLGVLTQMLMVLQQSMKSASMHSLEGKESFRDAFDTLWEIESKPMYRDLRQHAAAVKKLESETKDEVEKANKKLKKKEKKEKEKAKEAGKDGKKDKKKDKEKKDKKKDPDEEAKKARKQYLEESGDAYLGDKLKLYKTYKKTLKEVEKAFAEHDMLQFQLTSMANYLPPLNIWAGGKWSLDGWQKDVLRAVDRKQSVIVAAPTSSGKTVCSTYVCEVATRVLFVVPTEPLVWQVASMFQAKLGGGVSMVTDKLQYRPDSRASRVTIGTPMALESALSGMLGKVWEHKFDYALVESGFDFDYAVYDEVHDLNGKEGVALQRLIRCVQSPFLALSATIGNPGELQSWWTSFNGVDTDGWPAVIDGFADSVAIPPPASAAAGAEGAATGTSVSGGVTLATRLAAERAAAEAALHRKADDSGEPEEGEEVQFDVEFRRPEGGRLGEIGLDFAYDSEYRMFKVTAARGASAEAGVRAGDRMVAVAGQRIYNGYDDEAKKKLQLQIKSAIRRNPFTITLIGPHRADRDIGGKAAAAARDEEERLARETRKGASTEPSKVAFSQFVGRFINLQRHIFIGGDTQATQFLHPLAALDRDYVEAGGLHTGDMAFTPRDTYELWTSLEKLAADGKVDRALVDPVSPSAFFGDAKGSTADRITLSDAKSYEMRLKGKLEELAKSHPAEVDALLDSFCPKSLIEAAARDEEVDPMDSLLAIVTDAKEKNLTPAICFQLDSVYARQMYDRVLSDLETAEDAKYPTYRAKKQEEYQKWLEDRERVEKMMSKLKEEETKDLEVAAAPDPWAPHPDFVLCSATSRVGEKEYSEIRDKLMRELAEKTDAEGRDSHPLLRGLTRGIAIYTDDAGLAEYQRVVQSLAQRGMLAVVFSDHSLAYGVNMPFRTCCFCGDTPSLLDPLMAQQMAGRAGRRGLDREGHLVFTGLSWERVKSLMRGTLPEVVGRHPLYPTIALTGLLSPHLQTETSLLMCSRPLNECRATFPQVTLGGEVQKAAWQAGGEAEGGGEDEAKGGDADAAAEEAAEEARVAQEAAEVRACFEAGLGAVREGAEYYLKSERWMEALGLVEYDAATGSVAFRTGMEARSKLTFILREYLPESLVLVQIMDHIYAQFCSNRNDRTYCESEGVQIDFLSILTRFVCIEPCPEGLPSLEEHDFHRNRREKWDKWSEIIGAAQETLRRNGFPAEAMCDDIARQDSTLFHCVMAASMPDVAVDTLFRHHLKTRLWKLGEMLRVLHNCMMHDRDCDEHCRQAFEMLTRKSFKRLQYIIKDMGM